MIIALILGSTDAKNGKLFFDESFYKDQQSVRLYDMETNKITPEYAECIEKWTAQKEKRFLYSSLDFFLF